MLTTTPTPSNRPGIPTLLSGRGIFRLGLALVLAACAFFLRHSIAQGWIGPLGRIGLSGGAGLAMIVVGLGVAQRRAAYGTLLQGGGTAVIYGTVFAADRMTLVGPGATLGALAAVSGLLVGLALRSDSEALATVGMIGSLAAPVLVGGIDGMTPAETVYGTAIIAVSGLLYALRRWRWEIGATMAGTALLLVAETGRVVIVHSPDRVWPLVAALGVTWLGLWLLPVLVDDERPALAVAATATVPFLAYLGFLAAAAPSTGIATAVGLAMAAAHLGVARAVPHPLVASAQLVAASTLAVLAWASSLDGAGLVAVLAAQAAMTLRLERTAAKVTGHVLFGIAGWLWLGALAAAGRGLDASDLATALTVALAGLTAVTLTATPRRAYGAAAVLGGLLWAAVTLDPLGSGWVTAAWAAEGIALTAFTGGTARNGGMAIILLSVGRLLLVDTAAVAPVARVALFAGIGVALLGLGYWLDDAPPAETADETADEHGVRE